MRWNSTSSWSPAGNIVGALYHKLYTQSSAPDDGRNYRPKNVELIEIINKIIIVASSWLSILFNCLKLTQYAEVHAICPTGSFMS